MLAVIGLAAVATALDLAGVGSIVVGEGTISVPIVAEGIVAYAVVNPFGWDSVVSTLQFGIIGVTTILLTILTYYAGRAVEDAEKGTGHE
jgi:ABC-type tungstate transport system substrate-binding protein